MEKIEKALLDHAPEGVFWTREDGSFAYINQTAFRNLGYSRDDLMALKIFDLDPDMNPARWEKHWKETDRHDLLRIERRHRRRDGSLMPVEVQIQHLIHDGEEVHFSYVRDLTEKYETETRRRGRQYFQSLFFNAPLPQFIVDPTDMNIVSANTAAIEYYDYGTGLIGKRLPDIETLTEDEIRQNMILAQDGRRHFFPVRHRLASGEVRDVHVHTGPIEHEGRAVLHLTIDDVTRQKRVEEDRRELFQQFKSAIENAPIPVMLFRASGRIETVNSAWLEITGYRRDQIITFEDWTRFAFEEGAEVVLAAIRKLPSEAGSVAEGDFEIRCADGRTRTWAFYSAPLESADVSDRLIMSTAIDVTEERRREQHGRQAEAIIQSAAEGITITDAEGRIERVDPAFSRITGYAAEEVVGKNPRILSSGRQDKAFYKQMWEQINTTGHWQGEVWNRRKNGEIYPEWLSISEVRDAQGELLNYAGIFADLTEMKRSQSELEQLQYFDSLTGLPNRRMLMRILEETLVKAESRSGQVAVLVCGLDHFRMVNESFSHLSGDRALRLIADRLGEIGHDNIELGRTTGDQFGLVIGRGANQKTILYLLDRIASISSSPIDIGESRPLHFQLTTGIARYPGDGKTPQQLLTSAEAAMFDAKQQQRGSHAFFSSEKTEATHERLILETELRKAIDNAALEVHFQPVVSISDNAIVGMEALARWPRPGRDPVSPDVFIPLAEQAGLIDKLSFQLLESACRAAVEIERDSSRALRLAFNISALQLVDKSFVDRITTQLASSGIEPRRFELELTESTLLEQAGGSSRILKRLHKAGIRISIDDFGTGFSSLAYLQEIDAQVLKIDRRFIRDIPANQADARIAASIITMAHALDMEVIAEGVETPDQLEFLRDNGCEYFQGYLFSKPLPLSEFKDLYSAHQ
ncbi:MAG: EAL domain-containing protein [Xanthomonadales bacterium]|nr:EAL domain-containing protein [Xanthomonadales bacterium]